jgi:hypothetical protein
MSTAEFRAFLGSQPQTHPSTKDKQSSQERRLLPLWVLHTASMLAFLIIFITPVYQAADTVRQAPLRELASLASQVQFWVCTESWGAFANGGNSDAKCYILQQVAHSLL